MDRGRARNLVRWGIRVDMKSTPTNATIVAKTRSFVGADFMSAVMSDKTMSFRSLLAKTLRMRQLADIAPTNETTLWNHL